MGNPLRGGLDVLGSLRLSRFVDTPESERMTTHGQTATDREAKAGFAKAYGGSWPVGLILSRLLEE